MRSLPDYSLRSDLSVRQKQPRRGRLKTECRLKATLAPSPDFIHEHSERAVENTIHYSVRLPEIKSRRGPYAVIVAKPRSAGSNADSLSVFVATGVASQPYGP